MADWKEKQRFTDRDADAMETLLSDLVDHVDVTWYWDDDGCLVVDGLFDGELVTFSNWRSAKAGLELFRRGYQMGQRRQVMTDVAKIHGRRATGDTYCDTFEEDIS